MVLLDLIILNSYHLYEIQTQGTSHDVKPSQSRQTIK